MLRCKLTSVFCVRVDSRQFCPFLCAVSTLRTTHHNTRCLTSSAAFVARSSFNFAKAARPSANRSSLISIRTQSSDLSSNMDMAVEEKSDITSKSCAADRLRAFRERMVAHKIDAFTVGTSDAHQSEYVADCDKRLGFLSGFHGSAGRIVVTATEALLWTDGRYFVAAAKELSDDWTLMKAGLPETPTVHQYLADNLFKDSVIGVDALLTSVSFYNALKSKTEAAGKNITIQTLKANPIDEIWSDQPERPRNKVKVHDIKYAGETVTDKLTKIRASMEKEKAKALVVSALDSIAWLLNLRGNDIIYNPVFFSYVIVTSDKCVLYIDPKKLEENAEVKEHLNKSNITIKKYTDFISDLSVISDDSTLTDDMKIWYASDNCNLAIYSAIKAERRLDKDNPIEILKACKNDIEIEGMKNAHIRDGIAKTKYLAWIDQLLQDPSTKLSDYNEWTFAEKLESLRRAQDLFIDLSFETISSTGANGAIIHYSPTADECSTIEDKMYLCDSGGQYCDGTTDVTRTIHLGKPTEHEMECYTRVLKGVISLSRVVFPHNTKGPLLDSLARISLWESGLDYLHGTGHGVGAFLNVHEGPMGFSASTARKQLFIYGIRKNMCITIEPGYYEEGNFGIRIENVMVCVPSETKHKFNGTEFLTFEPITMIPIDTKLIDMSLMTDADKKWLNDYHQKVREVLEPHMTEDYEKQYLQKATEAI